MKDTYGKDMDERRKEKRVLHKADKKRKINCRAEQREERSAEYMVTRALQRPSCTGELWQAAGPTSKSFR
jgi:hypothetical protein